MLQRTIGVSLLFHIVLAYLLLDKNQKPVRRHTPFISLVEMEKPKAAAAASGNNAKKLKTKKGKTDGFGKGNAPGSLESVLRSPVAGLAGTTENGGGLLAFGDRGDVSAEGTMKMRLELNGPLAKVWQRIRSNIHYHSDFFIGGIEGNVDAQVVLGRRGRIESLKSISGNSDLVEWVKTALCQALKNDIFTRDLPRKLLLHLTFHFEVLLDPPPYEEFIFDDLNLHFNVWGFSRNGTTAVRKAYNLVNRTKMNKVSEWNFSKKMEPYRDSCFIRKNRIGCETLIQYLTEAGLHQDVHEARKFMNANLKQLIGPE